MVKDIFAINQRDWLIRRWQRLNEKRIATQVGRRSYYLPNMVAQDNPTSSVEGKKFVFEIQLNQLCTAAF